MIYTLLVAAVVLLDQWFKSWIVEHIAEGGSRAFLPGVLSLTHVHNYGAAFSILRGMTWFFLAVTLVFVVAAFAALVWHRMRSTLGNISLALVLGGALGNALDRFANPGGYVVDMFQTEFIDFAIFNVADCFIVVGGILFCIYVLLSGRKAKPDAASSLPEEADPLPTERKNNGGAEKDDSASGARGDGHEA